MAITFTNFFGQGTHDRLNALGQDNLTRGVNLVHDGNTYNVKMLETHTEEGAHAILIFRAYTADSVLIYTKYKSGHNPRLEEEIIGTKINLFHMIHNGAVIDGDVATPIFAGVLSPEAAQVFGKHPDLAPKVHTPDAPSSGYSRNQKAFALFVSVLALTTVGYGIHKVRKGDISIPTRQDVSKFLSDTKNTLSDYLAQMKQKLRPQDAPIKV